MYVLILSIYTMYKFMYIHVPKHYAVYYKSIQLLSVGRLQKQKNVYMNTKNHKRGHFMMFICLSRKIL